MTATAIHILTLSILNAAAYAAEVSQLNFYQVASHFWDGTRTRDLLLTPDIGAQDGNTQVLQCVMQLSRRGQLGINECLVFQPGAESRCFIGALKVNCETMHPLTAATGANSTKVWVTELTQRYNCSVIQQRVSNSANFYRNWAEYVNGFGEGQSGNFWIGLQNIYRATRETPRVLRIEMKLWNGSSYWASYSSFQIASASDQYRLISLGSFTASSAQLGDCMSLCLNQRFSTFDADYDSYNGSCSLLFKGGWWYGHCHCTNPNGFYFVPPDALHTLQYATGVVWNLPFGYHYSMKDFKMILL